MGLTSQVADFIICVWYESAIFPCIVVALMAVVRNLLDYQLIKSLAWYRCSTLMVPCATLSRYRSYHSLGTGTTEVI